MPSVQDDSDWPESGIYDLNLRPDAVFPTFGSSKLRRVTFSEELARAKRMGPGP